MCPLLTTQIAHKFLTLLLVSEDTQADTLSWDVNAIFEHKGNDRELIYHLARGLELLLHNEKFQGGLTRLELIKALCIHAGGRQSSPHDFGGLIDVGRCWDCWIKRRKQHRAPYGDMEFIDRVRSTGK
jgi:hypothetical protein